MSKHWLVYSREHNAWWRANAAGYTNDIAQAGRYAEAGAKFHCNAHDKQPDDSPSEVAVIAPEFQVHATEAERLLANCTDRLRAAIIAGGSDEEFADIAVQKYRAFLDGAKPQPDPLLIEARDAMNDARNPEGDYYLGLRCGVEDRTIHDRYEAAEFGWNQAFEYIDSALDGARDKLDEVLK